MMMINIKDTIGEIQQIFIEAILYTIMRFRKGR